MPLVNCSMPQAVVRLRRGWALAQALALLLAGLWPAIGQLVGHANQSPALVQVCTHVGLAWVQQDDPA